MLNYSIHGKHLLYPIRNVFFPFWKLNTSEEYPLIKNSLNQNKRIGNYYFIKDRFSNNYS